MTSRERLITVIKGGKADHVPLYFKVHNFKPPPEIEWKNDYERSKRWLSMGLDDILFIHSPLTRNDWLGLGDPVEFDKSMRMKVSILNDGDEKGPLIVKEYNTPDGTLSHRVRKTKDWDFHDDPYDHGGDDLLLFDDYNVSRSTKFLIENEDDLKKLKYIFPLPSKRVLNDYKRYVHSVKRKASQLGVLSAVCTSTGIDTLIWLCGIENTIFMAYDKPDMFESLIEIVHQRDILCTEICLDLGIDMIIRRGWYEGCNLWSPPICRRYFLPNVKEIAKLVHGANKLFGYILPYGIMPILPDLLNVGYDVHWFIDDVQGDTDFKKVKQLFSGKISILGGINEAITLEMESHDIIKKRVYRAVEILGKGGGFIVSVVDSLYSSTPWKSVQAVIKAWNEVKSYT